MDERGWSGIAWTTPRTWVTGELVTAAQMNTDVRDNINFLASWESAIQVQDANGFTNTSYADLDALTTVPFSSPVIVTVTTGTVALVIVSAGVIRNLTAPQICHLGFRVSGATTTAASDNYSAGSDGSVTDRTKTLVVPVTLTAGVNTFELQARVSANTGRIINPALTVIPQA